MGIVYKAFDTHLQRTVALKVLRSKFLTDSRHLARFLLEARAASALNHPNICTVHDAGEEQGVCYIVLEYLEGQTLRSLLKQRRSLPLEQVLHLSAQICDGLSAAHQKGIIHRDIKPENILLTKAGVVKIMDFGLAKLKYEQAYSASSDPPDPLTPCAASTLSSLMGTAAYMSPEQIEKRSIDERTDLFSLAMVLYEVISGEHPFRGEDLIAVMKSIVHDPPYLFLSRKDKILFPVLSKALAKKPSARYAHAGTFKAALQNLQHQLDRRRVRYRWSFILMMLLPIVGYLLYQVRLKVGNLPSSRPISSRLMPIGQTMENEEWPVFSPDGQAVLYSSRQTGELEEYELCIKDLETQQRRIIVNSRYSLVSADWSPDGEQIAYSTLGQGIFITDTSGIRQQQVVSFGYLPRWSPDGRQLAFSTRRPSIIGSENAIYLYTIENGHLARISPDNGLKFTYPEWSPDGRRLLVTAGEGSIWNLWLLEPTTRKTKQLTDKRWWLKNPIWSRTGHHIYFISDQNGLNEVWRQRIDVDQGSLIGEPTQLTFGADIDELDVSAVDERLLVTRVDDESELWRLQLSFSNRNPIKQAKKILTITGSVDNIALSPDRQKLALEVVEKGMRYFLVRNLIDQSETALQCHWNMFAPSWSPDCQWIAFDAGGGNQADIYRIHAKGGQPQKLVAAQGADWMPSYSSIDQQFCFLSNRSGSFQIWLSNSGMSKPVPLTELTNMITRASWSHDGTKLAFFENENFNSGGSWICLYDLSQRRCERVMWLPLQAFNMPIAPVWRWDDKALYFISQNERGVLEEVDLQSQTIHHYRFLDLGYPFLQTTFSLFKETGYFIQVNHKKDIWITEGQP